MTDEFGIEDYLAQYVDNDEEEEEGGEEEFRYTYIETLDAPRDLPEPVDLTIQHLKDIAYELGLIKLCWPEIENPEFENRTHFPAGYLSNSEKEKLLLLYAENFRRQFCHLFPLRKQLFLACENECGMQKMVCTTIRPTTLPYPQLETWEECARFVGSHLGFEVFQLPTLIPNRLYSPHTTFIRQSGQPHELATALCSLLIGLGYDAYVVFGYATRDVTHKIMYRVNSPYPPFEKEVEAKEEGKEQGKYAVKPPRDLRSKFLLMMEQKAIDKKKEEEEKIADIARQQEQEKEIPPPDDLDGMRIHFWILMRTEGRTVDEIFFIEPSTGVRHPIDTPNYSGIEAVWNNVNYWINMQDCSNGLANLDYNLHDVAKWEHFLIGEPVGWRQAKLDLNMDDDEMVLARIMDEKHLDMPMNWSLRINIPHHVLAQKFPNGMSKTWYKRTLVEEFAPYIQTDGLVRKITRFKDFECTQCSLIEEYFENRQDKMYLLIHDLEADTITEYFGPGREDAVIKHSYIASQPNAPNRKIKFNHKARYDGLKRIEIKNENMLEEYVDREDFFYFREVNFAKKGHPPPGFAEGHRRIILDVIEKFNRNESKPASDDIAMREFTLIDRQINLRYHFAEGKVTASTRTFIKPPVEEMAERLRFSPENTYGYVADLDAKPPRQLTLFLLFERMIKEEEHAMMHIREIEDLIEEFLLLRDHEIAFPKLEVALFDRDQNEEYRLGMLEKERLEQEYKEKEIDDAGVDYLSPYLAKLGNPEKLTKQQAAEVETECLNDFKQMLLRRAQDIQRQFDYWTGYLKEKQAWYAANQDTISEEDELTYFRDVNDLTFLLQAYEIRLARHRDLSAVRYAALVHYLKVNLEQLTN